MDAGLATGFATSVATGVAIGSAADWATGLAFGFAGFLLFQESFTTRLSILYFVVWGLFYGIIRLRTGSWLGIALAQSLQTLTAWHLLPRTDVFSLGYLYGISGIIYIIVIWRLFPKTEADFRV